MRHADAEAAAIEAGANEVEPLTHAQNDDIPEGATGARFITEPTDCTPSRNGSRRTAGRW